MIKTQGSMKAIRQTGIQVPSHTNQNTGHPLLKRHEVVTGKVLKVLSNDMALLLIKGKEVMARTSIPLQAGGILSLLTEKVTPIPVLRPLGSGAPGMYAINVPLILAAIKGNYLKSISRRSVVPEKIASQILDHFQRLNHLVWHQDRKVFIPMPVLSPDGICTVVELLIHLPEGENRKDAKNGEPGRRDPSMKISVQITLSRLGTIRADLMVRDKQVEGKLFLSNPQIRSEVEKQLPHLIERLREDGFIVSYLSCSLFEANAAGQTSLIMEIIPEQNSGFSQVV